MLAEIAISPDGKVTIITREGTFESGVELVNALIQTVQSSGVEVQNVKFEQHRHDDMQVHTHVRDHAKIGGHRHE